MPALKLGRRAAVADARVPFFHALAAATALPPPPPWVNWYAGVPAWGMLGNADAGDCVEAAIAHSVLQTSIYAGHTVAPNADETLAAYSAITGYDPANPDTDQGTEVMGPGGALQYWMTKGLVFGSVRSKATAYLQLDPQGPIAHLQQAVHFFGGVLLGINLPANIVQAPAVPFVWRNPTGPAAGGHEVWVCGYQTEPELLFDFVTWGQRCRMPAAFLLSVAAEAVAVYDPDSLSARGLNGDDFDSAELLRAMAALKAAA